MDCVKSAEEGTFRTYVVISMKTKACCVSYSNHHGVGSARSADISKSRIGVKEYVFNKHIIKVCVSYS